MNIRTSTKSIKIGTITIGGSNEIVIQSMCNVKTSHVDEVVSQINECASVGAQLMRVSVLDLGDAKAIKEIKNCITVPLVADIHFDYKLAIEAIKNGADKIRINPGNIGKDENLIKIIDVAKEYNVAIRIGVNSGSLEKDLLTNTHLSNSQKLVESAKRYVQKFESLGFTNIVISLKSSDVLDTIEAYRLAAESFIYPLHLGVTEAGFKDLSLIRSAAGLSPLLLEGIGGTLRISISGDPKDEIIAAKRLLHDLGLYPNYPTVISCPTCGRTEVEVTKIANEISNYLEKINKPIKVAIMGCVVNGPGEAKHADIGIAGGNKEFVLFKKGEIIKKVSEQNVLETLIEEINNF